MKSLLKEIMNTDQKMRKKHHLNQMGKENAFLNNVFCEDIRYHSKPGFGNELLTNGLVASTDLGINGRLKTKYIFNYDNHYPLFEDLFRFADESGEDVRNDYCFEIQKTVIEYFRKEKISEDNLLMSCQAEYIINRFRKIPIDQAISRNTQICLSEAVYFDISGSLPKKEDFDFDKDDPFFDKLNHDRTEFVNLMNTVGLHSRSGMLAILSLAEKGNIYAMQSAGTIEFFGLLGKRNMQNAFNWHYRQLREIGSGQAAWSIADMMFRYDLYKDQIEDFNIYYPDINGDGILRKFEKPTDSKELQKWNDEIVGFLLLSYQRGSKAAGNLISQIIENKSIPLVSVTKLKKMKSAREWALDSAEGGNPHGMLRMYEYCCQDAKNADNDEEKKSALSQARSWLEKSAELYLPVSMNKLCIILHEEGKDEEAKNILHKLLFDKIGANGNYYGAILTVNQLYPHMLSLDENKYFLNEAIEGAQKQYYKNPPKGNLEFISKCKSILDSL